VTTILNTLEREAGDSYDPRLELESTFNNALQTFRQEVERRIINNDITLHTRNLRQALSEAVYRHIDTVKDEQGLYWTDGWLQALRDSILRKLEDLARAQNFPDPYRQLNRNLTRINDALNAPLLPERRARGELANAAKDLSSYFNNTLLDSVINTAMRHVLLQLRQEVETLQSQVRLALEFWQELAITQPRFIDDHYYDPVTQSVLNYTSREELIDTYEALFTALSGRSVQSVHEIDPMIQPQAAVSGHTRSVSLSLLKEANAVLRKRLDDFCRKYYHDYLESKGTNVLDRLRETTIDLDRAESERIREMTQIQKEYRSLAERAEPLLAYRPGMMQSIPPRVIKVIGAETEQAAASVRDSGVIDPGDVAAIGMGDATRLIFLTTHHGIPAYALSKFDEYRAHYERMQDQPNNIFHLDPLREREPHNPDSANFINLHDFETYFARALAYDWILRISLRDGGHAFVLAPDFHRQYQQVVNEEGRRLLGEAEKYEFRARDMETSVNALASTYKLRARHLRDLETNLNEAFRRIKQLPDRPEYALYLYTQIEPVQELQDAIEALYGGGSRLLGQLFIPAFKRHYEEQRPSIQDVRTFLAIRGYKLNPNERDINSPPALTMYFSEAGHNYDLEKWLCDLLRVYERVETKRSDFPNWHSGYWRSIFPDESGPA
jgi:hypothetical protein